MVLDAILRFKTQTITERHVGTDLPVIFRIKPAIHKGVFNQRIAAKNRQLVMRARYLITPTLMQLVMEGQELFGSGMRLCFRNNPNPR